MSVFDDVFGAMSVGIAVPTLVDDGHGNEEPEYPTSWSPLDGVDMQPGASQEDSINRNGTAIDYTLYAPIGAALSDDMRVRYPNDESGSVFEVVGEVVRLPDPLGVTDFLKVLLRRWRG